MVVKINLKNGSEKLECSSVVVEDKYLKVSDCKIDNLIENTLCTRFYRLVNVMSYDIMED